eukprot:Awhi_evm1s10970
MVCPSPHRLHQVQEETLVEYLALPTALPTSYRLIAVVLNHHHLGQGKEVQLDEQCLLVFALKLPDSLFLVL